MLTKISLLASAAAASAAGAAAHVDHDATLILLVASGLAGVIGMLYDRQTTGTGAARDFLITVVLAFVLGVAFGGPIGDTALAQLEAKGMDGNYRTAVGAHIGGGLLIGIFMRVAIQFGGHFFGRKRRR